MASAKIYAHLKILHTSEHAQIVHHFITLDTYPVD
jgi:hypothetical protein